MKQILRSVKDSDFMTNLPMAVQATFAGGAVGAYVSVVKHPLDRSYLKRVYRFFHLLM